MKLSLNTFREAIGAVSAAVNEGKVGIAVVDDVLVIYGQKPDGFLISKKIKDVDDIKPINVTLDYSFIRASLAFFGGDVLYIEKKETSLFFHTEDGEDYARMEAPCISLGEMSYNDMSGENYVDSIFVRYLPHYVNKTAHALELMKFVQTGSDSRKSSFFFQTDGQNISLTTTDGRRISLRSGKMGKIKYSFLIPGDYLKAASAQLGNAAKFDISEKKNILRIVDDDTTIILPVMSNEFFCLDKVVNDSYNGDGKFIINRSSLIAACEMVSLLSDKATFTISENKLTVSGTDQIALNEKTIAIKNNGKTKTFIAVTRFMSDALKSFSSENVNIIVTENMCNIAACEDGKKKEGKAIEIVLLCKF